VISLIGRRWDGVTKKGGPPLRRTAFLTGCLSLIFSGLWVPDVKFAVDRKGV